LTLPEGERTFSALVLGEASPAAEGPVEWQSRFGVAIDRKRQSAADHMLVRRLVPEAGLAFRATGRLTTDTLRTDFEAAVCATTHLGSNRSGGLARVEMDLRWVEPATAPDRLPAGDCVEIAFELTAPASLGVPLALPTGNFRDTRRCIPGSAMRGAIGFALAESLPDPNDPDFQALVDPEHGAIFDFFYDVDATQAAGLPGPWPLTVRACKNDPEHGVTDTLLDTIAVQNLGDLAGVGALDAAYTCPTCKGQLGGTGSSRRSQKPPKVQIVTRVSMDRRRSSAKDGALFSYAQIVRGVRFAGQIRHIPERSRAYLARALAGPLSVGRARSLGWGSLRVLRCGAPAPLPSVGERGHAFDAALSKRLGKSRRTGRLIPITLLSPLVLRSDEEDGCATLEAALGIPVRGFPVVARRFDLERGWDQRTGPRDVVRVARAGSVFVAELPEGQRWDQALAALARLEAEGAGSRTRMGFGRVICFDPMIGQGARKP
jgi:CRISPR-associated protein Csx10